MWRLNWFLRDFGYDTELLGRDEVDEKTLIGLTGIIRTSRKTLAGRSFLNFDGFAPATEWEPFHLEDAREGVMAKEVPMTYSYTQISQYLRCPRQYRYRYLDGWREKEDTAAMIFGRCFEKALSSYFAQEDSPPPCSRSGATPRHRTEYRKNDSWDRLYHQGVHLLERFAQDDRVRIRRPKQDLQMEFKRSLPGGCDFVSYVDAIGEVDGTLHHRLENNNQPLSG